MVQIGLLTALILLGMVSAAGPWEALENSHYDLWAGQFRSPEHLPIAIVAIDDKSIREMGDWPWPRTYLAEAVKLLSSWGADSQGICFLFTQPAVSPGIEAIGKLKAEIADRSWKDGQQTVKWLETMLDGLSRQLDQDSELVTAVRKARNAVLPLLFTSDALGAENEDKASGLLIVNSLNLSEQPEKSVQNPSLPIAVIQDVPRKPLVARGVWETFDILAAKAGALGHLNLREDPDGVVRRVPLLVQYKDRLAPAFSLQLALKHIGARLRELEIDRDFFGQPRLRAQHLTLPTDGAYQMLLSYDPQWTRERTYSIADVLNGAVDASLFKDKIVLIGVTAGAMTRTYRVDSHVSASAVEINANILAWILSANRLSRPSWSRALEATALLYFAFFLVFVIPRVTVRLGLSILAVFLVTWYAVGVGLLLGYGYWIKLFGPMLLACAGFISIHATLSARRRGQERLEDNKTLGLAYQGQGMLDRAYEKYMQCPVEDMSVKNLLYSLALDFERKRMFNKALAIYQHIRSSGTFKDVAKRSERLKPLDSTMALSVAAGETPLLMDDTSAKPTFGRYELLQELGRGSMGTVYLGRDPKINRRVAIKTLSYAEVDSGDLADVKARFFREAEAAGKLSHPNIVSIYDVGEEHDMAYIAMELLAGENLAACCRQQTRLDVVRVLDIMGQVTGALDYAHSQGVVHRDIKPANIMVLEDGRVKVTDFGIAQVVDAGKTRTGIVLGTPNYMSPEQVAGKKLDGRSDLFSLGIVFYELLTGAKPFKGDSVNTILYAITHNPYVPVSEAATGIPTCCEAIVDKLLAKGVTKRFRTAALANQALAACRNELVS